ncbi:MAG: DUF1064 domain-containing protein [Clostridia bacterium]|nr:DUF1064 domain-containing protein [Clostridia bacterium]
MTLTEYKALGKKKNKHNAVRTIVDGEIFHSKKEADRWCALRVAEMKGLISNLRRQVPYVLIPAQYEEVYTDEVYKRGPNKGKQKKKKVCVEQSVVYNADFVYDMGGKTIVEDSKGQRFPDYIIKRKLMLYVHKIKVVET